MKAIKTIKIASIATACGAVLILALPALSGNNSIKEKKAQKTESIIEKFKRVRGPKAGTDKDQIPPLIKEATDFALYLNPPKPIPEPEARRTATPRTQGIPNVPSAPAMSTARFNLIATCVNKADPESSLALIQETGQDRRWVRQAATIGHLTIKEIHDGRIIIQDGARTYQLDMTNIPQEISLLTDNLEQQSNVPDNKTNPLNIGTPATISSTQNTLTIRTPKQPDTTVRTNTIEPPVMTDEQEKILEKFMDEIDSLITSAGDDPNAMEKSLQKSDEIIAKYFEQLDNMTLDQQESEDIKDLGEWLKDTNDSNDPNSPGIE